MKKNKGIFILIILCVVISFTYTPQKIMAASTQGSDGKTKACIVTFNANGGDEVSETRVVTCGSTYGELPVATRGNYVFSGWYTFPSAGTKITEDSIMNKSGTLTIYAHWKGEECEIALDANGGELENETITVYYGSKFINQLPIPHMEYNTFDGWYTAANDGDKITVKSIFNKDSARTLYAHWTKKSIKIVFIGFNGEMYEIQVEYGEPYGELPEPTRENFVFAGWYTLRDYTNSKAEPITKDNIASENSAVRLFARWYNETEGLK